MRGAALVAVFGAAALVSAAGPWQTYKSWRVPYQIELPTPVIEETVYASDDSGSYTVYCATAEDVRRSYSVRVTEITPAWRRNRSDAEILEAVKQGTRTMDRMKLVSLSEKPIHGYPAVRFRVEIPDSAHVHHLAVLTPEYLYHLMVVTPPKANEEAEADRYFQGFRVSIR